MILILALATLRMMVTAVKPFVFPCPLLSKIKASDRRDLNRFFPGSDTGSLTSQLADVFMREVVDKCTHGVDLHAGSNHRTNLPQIRVDTTKPVNYELAVDFRTPVIVNTKLRDGSKGGPVGVAPKLSMIGQR